jgi:hypothetical protein
MKIALKYGLLITLVVVAWVVIVRFVMDAGAESQLNSAAPVLFNLTAFLSIYFGIKQRKLQMGDRFTFKEGMQIGSGISLVYAVSSCLFFVIEYLVAGPKLLMTEAGLQTRPLWQVALMAYAGLFFGALIFGIMYSAVSAFFLVRHGTTEKSL